MRHFLRAAMLVAGVAGPAAADIDAALDRHVLPRMDALAEATAALGAAACDPAQLRPLFGDAAEAWAGAAHLTLGPAEAKGRARAILFWPDDRDATGRGLRLLQEQGPAAWTLDAVARASVAARGLGALERLIWEDGAEPCALTLALADDLAATAEAIRDEWRGGFADLMRDPGGPGNTRFLAPDEVNRALFTALLAGLERIADQDLGRPLGTFERPRPQQAALYRSEMSLPTIRAALASLRELAATLAEAPRTEAALARAVDAAGALDDPALAGVADPMGRVRVEALQSTVRDARAVAAEEIGAALDVGTGFNSADGD